MRKDFSKPIPLSQLRQRKQEIVVAKKYERKLRQAFKGIYSYKVRKTLLAVRDKDGE